jgi:serine-type D-Ala-D-Ala carboxypeptidase (penicillin-binding protein 5/6)
VRRRAAAFLPALLVALALSAVPGVARARAAPPPPPPPPPQAWIVVDAGTGAVVDASNERVPLRAASVIKLLTALIAVEQLPADANVPVSPVTEGMPARKINMKAGQTWGLKDTLHSLLLVSANDAAVALAERVSGSRADFAATMAGAGHRLGLEDSPRLRDPAGLDAEPFAFEGGNLISARDLAIVARAALAQPEIRMIVATESYRFHGGDGIDHRVLNHNMLLKAYPGATGMKTGYTKGAGHTLIGSATRDGRTMISVVLNAVDPPGSSARLLDAGFLLPVALQGARGYLPPVASVAHPAPSAPPPPPREVQVASARGVTAPGARNRRSTTSGNVLVLILGCAPALAIVGRRRRLRGERDGKLPFFTWG